MGFLTEAHHPKRCRRRHGYGAVALRCLMICAVVLFLWVGRAAAVVCDGPVQVCEFGRYVFGLEIDGVLRSAVYVEPGLVVTNRHVVLHRKSANLISSDGETLSAKLLPTDYPGDLVLLTVEGLDLGSARGQIASTSRGQAAFVVAYDPQAKRVRAYPRGGIVLPPAMDRPLARIQHDAPGGIGSDGGALVGEDGQWLGVATFGAGVRNEAIPTSEIAALKSRSSAAQSSADIELGNAYRHCVQTLEQMPKRRARLARRAVVYLREACEPTRNAQLLDEVGRVLGRAGHVQDAIGVFSGVLEMDPHALRSREGLVVAQFLSGEHAKALPHLKWLVDILGQDPEILRLAIQGGKIGGDTAFAEDALSRLERLNLALALPMRRFLDAAIPPPAQGGRNR
jgi:hypothetical protein